MLLHLSHPKSNLMVSLFTFNVEFNVVARETPNVELNVVAETPNVESNVVALVTSNVAFNVVALVTSNVEFKVVAKSIKVKSIFVAPPPKELCSTMHHFELLK